MGQIITGLERGEGGKYAIICGDPARVPRIASLLEGSEQVRNVREFNIMAGALENERVLVASTGIGGPSTAILMEEMANTGTDTFIRVGTSGGVARGLKRGEAVITTAAYRRDGTSRSYVPDNYPAVAHHDVVQALLSAASSTNMRVHAGVTLSIDGFYSENRVLSEGKHASMAHGGFLLASREKDLVDAQRLNVKNIEMEMGTVLTLTTLWGIRGGGICLISDLAPWEPSGEIMDAEKGMDHCISVAVGALRLLIKKDR
ncbi:MAG: nucleoside phosphorylase [Methanomassiliicoccales archaeon]